MKNVSVTSGNSRENNFYDGYERFFAAVSTFFCDKTLLEIVLLNS